MPREVILVVVHSRLCSTGLDISSMLPSHRWRRSLMSTLSDNVGTIAQNQRLVFSFNGIGRDHGACASIDTS